MALLACLLGYGEVGLWLKKQASLPDSWVQIEGNPYRKWIEDYSGEHYQGAVKLGLGQSFVHDISWMFNRPVLYRTH
jgi:hydroxymethylpyrimidine/phosphomethylpyrimidine kinase